MEKRAICHFPQKFCVRNWFTRMSVDGISLCIQFMRWSRIKRLVHVLPFVACFFHIAMGLLNTFVPAPRKFIHLCAGAEPVFSIIPVPDFGDFLSFVMVELLKRRVARKLMGKSLFLVNGQSLDLFSFLSKIGWMM